MKCGQLLRADARTSVLKVSVAVSLGMLTQIGSYAQSITWLGRFTYPWSVSADGSVVVGHCECFNYNRPRAFRWTSSTGKIDLGTLGGGSESIANDVSDDGNVVVGWSQNSFASFRAFRWTSATGMVDIHTDQEHPYSIANAVSADGTVVVGKGRQAFRWTESTGMQDLGTLPSYDWSEAYDVSADGSVVVGTASGSSGSMAFLWTASTNTMVSLGTLGGNSSHGRAVSPDGAVVVGWSYDNQGYTKAFRWTQSQNMTDLGVESYGELDVTDVSLGGSVIVGWLTNGAEEQRAFRWTPESGYEDLTTTFASLLPNGSYLERANAVSANGRYIVGTGYNSTTGLYEGYLLDTGSRCTQHNGDVDQDGCVDDADLLAVLFAFGNAGDEVGRMDTNCDGRVDDADLLTVLFAFGSGCS